MKQSENKVLTFMRKNAVYLVLALCIVAVGVAVTFMLLSGSGDNVAEVPNDDQPVIETPVEPDTPSDPVGTPDDPSDSEPVEKPDDPVDSEPVEKPDDPGVDVEPVDKPIIFVMPVETVISIGEYSETMVFNSTLGRFSAHLAIDFYAEEGAPVIAVYDGTVTNVETTLLHGTTVTIDHGNGLFTMYNSLADGDNVTVGQTVKQGDVIGEVSVTNRQEYKAGAHLHFQVIENGEVIDPAKYLTLNEK